MRQHWVPRFYLEGFTDPDTPDGLVPACFDPFIWVFDKNQRCWKRKAPKNLAAETNYYSPPDDSGKPDPRLEEFLAQQEGAAATVLREKVFKREPLEISEIATLSSFIGLLALRVPAHQDNIARAIEEIGQVMLRLNHDAFRRNPRLLEDLKKEVQKEEGDLLVADLKPEDFDPAKYSVHANKAYRLETALWPFDLVAKALVLKHWVVFYCQPPHFFITSDRPVAVCNPARPTGLRNAGFGEPTSMVTIPLSRTVCLMAGPGAPGANAKDASPEEVGKLNRMAVRLSNQLIFAPKPEFLGNEGILKGQI